MTNTSNKTVIASSKQQEFDSNFQEDCTPQEKLDSIIKHAKRRLKHAQRRLSNTNKRQSAIKENNGQLTEHAGWDKGYWEGKIAGLEDEIDDLNELKMMLNGKGE
jgi:hypothetical protein